jgi:hypothetical protein
MFNRLPELHKRATLRPGAVPGVPPPAFPSSVDATRAATHITQADMDATLEDSFPASDPPSWTAAIATPVPQRPAD